MPSHKFMPLLFGLLLLVGCASGEKAAQQLYGEAGQQLRAATTAAVSSHEQAYALYGEARRTIEKLLTAYPATSLARQLLAGEAAIDTLPLPAFLAREELWRRQAQAEREPLALAFLAATTIEDSFYQGQTLVALAAECARAGQYPLALEVVGACADADAKARGLIAVAGELGRSGAGEKAAATLAEALALARTVEEAGSRANTLQLLAASCAEAGLFAQAEAVRAEIGDPGFTSQALIRIGVARGRAGQSAPALRALGEARLLAKTLETPSYSERILAQLAAAYGALGHQEQGQALAETIAEPGARVEAWLALAGELVVRQREEKAAPLLGKGLAAGKTIAAPGARALALQALAEGYAQAHLFDQALTVAALIETEAGKAAALAAVAAGYAQSGQDDRALALAKGIAGDYWQARGLIGVAAVYAQAGQVERAEQLLAALLPLAKTIADPGERVAAWSRIAALQGGAGQEEKGRALLATALESVAAIEERLAQATALCQIAAAAPQVAAAVDPPTVKSRHALIVQLGKKAE